ncbi:UDP-N-acetylmuramoyl-L-alanyl-D-glutamate--2,6-diaminopimelate ligase [Streptomyces sp. NPDC089799]|uniref:UDP-N-acetylmuramoyl-L-alanyl-D-glutamate--2, 6-diaminopimelate ligase n=1 Tax=Streptomyces sp. NPDC089799 TaxID=3155066 RepID=UPI0034457F4E
MRLSDLLAGESHEVLQGNPSVQVTGRLVYDSRLLCPGDLFLAVPGRRTDGHHYIDAAVDSGATIVVAEKYESALPSHVCAVRVPDIRSAAAVLASRYYGEPGRLMDMIAITGTNGKTSVAFMIEAVLRAVTDAHVGVIGTAGLRVRDEPVSLPTTTPTTPEAVDLQHVLRLMRDRGADTVVLEASSMALAQHRVDRTFIDIGVFTNLTPDHLDDHGTMSAYKEAKLALFQGLARHAVVNVDDPVGDEITTLMPDAVTTFGIATGAADFRASDIVITATGTAFTLHHESSEHRARVPVPGRFAVANALATAATCVALGHSVPSVIQALADLPPTPGRFETISTDQGVTVVVDYAHSPDALESVLTTIRGFTRGRVITVFGCGGDRDPSKRAPMGKIAGRHSDLCILTSDNPRSEDPEAILDSIVAGITETGALFERHTDRRRAIERALDSARTDDTVLIAGKGSETYQIVGSTTLPFDDMETVRKAIRRNA